MLHNRYLVPGGEEQSTAAEVALLRDHGHEVELLEEDNRRVELLGKARTAVRTIWSSESYRRIDGKLQSGNFDVMHVQNLFPLWSPSIYYAASRNNVPVVQTLHNYRLMCVNSLFFRDQRICEDCLGRLLPWHGVVHALLPQQPGCQRRGCCNDRNAQAGGHLERASQYVHRSFRIYARRNTLPAAFLPSRSL